MTKAEQIFEKHIGLNAELGYLPIKKQDVLDAINEALTITDVGNNEERVSFCEVCESKKELRLIPVCVNEQCMCRYRAK